MVKQQTIVLAIALAAATPALAQSVTDQAPRPPGLAARAEFGPGPMGPGRLAQGHWGRVRLAQGQLALNQCAFPGR